MLIFVITIVLIIVIIIFTSFTRARLRTIMMVITSPGSIVQMKLHLVEV